MTIGISKESHDNIIEGVRRNLPEGFDLVTPVLHVQVQVFATDGSQGNLKSFVNEHLYVQEKPDGQS